MRAFAGYRDTPPQEYVSKKITNSGNSPDYQGVVFDDGTVAVRWLTLYGSHVIWPTFDAFYAVHGHPEYGTRIVWYTIKE